jgi:hypothetical protein
MGRKAKSDLTASLWTLTSLYDAAVVADYGIFVFDTVESGKHVRL